MAQASSAAPTRLNGETVLVLDDDVAVRQLFGRIVKMTGGNPTLCGTIAEAQAAAEAQVFAAAIIDKNLGNEDGLTFLRWLKAHQPDCEALIITGFGNMQTAIEALRLGASDYLLKPTEAEMLSHRLTLLCERRRMLMERDGLQAQLMQTDRMAALGTLAAGVVHEINNPLTYVLSNLEWIESELAGQNELQEIVSETRRGARQMASVVNHIKTFAHHGETARSRIHLPEMVEGTLKMTTVLIRQRAQLVREFEKVPEVEGVEFQLAQVFLNLLVNASHAIPEGKAIENQVKVRLYTNPAGEAVAEVIDSGAGMPPEVQRRLFEPFFTTKPKGIGTGIGLTICRNIVQGHGGRIEVESAPGKGSCFRIVLPAMAPDGRADAPTDLALERPGHGGRVLVIDDDTAVAGSIHRCLQREHRVAVDHGGRAALERIQKGERFDAIVCDVMMPDLTGHQLYEALEKDFPDQAARMVFITAGVLSEAGDALTRKFPERIIQKPLDVQKLRVKLREIISR